MQKNVADEKQVQDARLQERMLQQTEIEDVRFIIKTPQGRRFIWRVLSTCGMYSQSAVDSGSWTYFNEGRRSVGLKLLDKILMADPESYLAMIKENKEAVDKKAAPKKGNN